VEVDATTNENQDVEIVNNAHDSDNLFEQISIIQQIPQYQNMKTYLAAT
jgi:hypothetical protein